MLKNIGKTLHFARWHYADALWCELLLTRYRKNILKFVLSLHRIAYRWTALWRYMYIYIYIYIYIKTPGTKRQNVPYQFIWIFLDLLRLQKVLKFWFAVISYHETHHGQPLWHSECLVYIYIYIYIYIFIQIHPIAPWLSTWLWIVVYQRSLVMLWKLCFVAPSYWVWLATTKTFDCMIYKH